MGRFGQAALAQAGAGFTVGSLGACLVLLARDLAMPPESLGWLSSAFGIGLLLVGALGAVLLRRGTRPALRAAGLVAISGAVLLATAASAVPAAAGALLLGVGAAGLVLLTAVLLRGPDAAARLARVSAVSSVAGIVAPLAIGAVDAAGPSGRLALLVPVPALLVLVATTVRRGDSPADSALHSEEPEQPMRRVVRRWIVVVLAVSIEFCFVLWAVARLQETGLSPAGATAAGSAFVIGMAAGRAAGSRLTSIPHVVPLGCLVTGAATVVLSAAAGPVAVTAALVVAGLGISALYPVTLAVLMAESGLSAARSAALGTLASGAAVLAAPLALALISASLGIRAAFLIAVLPLAALLAGAVLWSDRRRREAPVPAAA